MLQKISLTDEFVKSIKQQFFHALTLGTGEAYLILKANPQVDFSALIIRGSITNLAYDRQCEGSRADYLFKIICHAKQKEKIIHTLLTKLRNKKTDDYGLDQMCDLAVCFYRKGYLSARDMLYARFEKNHLDGYEVCGSNQIIEIDGLSAFLKVIELRGKLLSEDENDWEDSWRIDDFQNDNKSIDVYLELEKAGVNNRYIHLYLEAVRKNNERSSTIKRRKVVLPYSYEEIKEMINRSSSNCSFGPRKTDGIPEDIVATLATEFLMEKDLIRRSKYLSFFSRKQFPYAYAPILQVAIGRNYKKTRLVANAVRSLKFFSGQDIRALALEKFGAKKNPYVYLELLVSNYRQGDAGILLEIINRSDHFDDIHSLVSGVLAVYEANPSKECQRPLEALYRKMNCGIHRTEIVQILNENHVLSDEIFKELQFDSDEDTRKLYRQIKKDPERQSAR